MDRYLPFTSKKSPNRREPDEDSLSGESLLSNQPTINSRHSPLRSWIPFIAHVIVIGVYTIIFLAAIQQRRLTAHKTDAGGIPVIQESQVFDVPIQLESPYVGEPRPELDDAWHELLQYTNIRIPEEELRRAGRLDEGIALPGGGYFGSLMVYHQLHCIKRLHHYFYEDHYFPDMTEVERRHNRQHSMHCLDILRQGIQCQGDTSIVTMRWGKNQAIPLANFTSPHECVNWDSLNEWSKERTVDVFAAGVLVHPELGPSFPDGKGDRIGAAEDS